MLPRPFSFADMSNTENHPLQIHVRQLQDAEMELHIEVNEAMTALFEVSRESERLQEEFQRLWGKSEQLKTEREKLEAQNGLSFFNMLLSLLSANDPFITTIPVRFSPRFDQYRLPQGYGDALGNALLGNTQVTKIDLDLSRLYPQGVSESSRKSLSILQYIATSPSLNEVVLHSARAPETLLSAIAANLAIKKFACSGYNVVSPHDLICLISSTRSIVDMDVSYQCGGYYYPADKAVDTGKELSLTKLKLKNMDATPVIPTILTHIMHCKSKLREFHLSPGGRPNWSLISQFLHAAPTLDHLEITDAYFNADSMDHLIVGLQPHSSDGSITTKISILSVRYCTFDETATERLTSFFQTPMLNVDGEVVYESSLCELCFWKPNFRGCSNEGRALVSMLTMQSLNVPEHQGEHLLRTIGSHVCALLLGNMYRLDDYIEAMRNNSARLRFACLQMEWLKSDDMLQVFKKLSFLPLLRELSLTSHCQKIDSGHPIMTSLCENGLLCNVRISDSGISSKTSLLDRSATKLANAYCRRNKFLPRFLGTKVLQGKDYLAIQRSQEDSMRPGKGDPLLYPALLMVARQTPMTHLPLLFSSLMVRGESIGRRTNRKRVAARAYLAHGHCFVRAAAINIAKIFDYRTPVDQVSQDEQP
jgi:hypothetical protein